MLCDAGVKTLLVRDNAHCDDVFCRRATARRAQCCALAAPFSLRASERFIAAALGATGVSDADYDKALASVRAQEILKSWGDSYDVAKI